MISIFVISLTDCHDRRQNMSTALNDLGLSFDFFDAVDGRYGLPTEYENQIDRAEVERVSYRRMTDAEYACSLSHINVYRKIIADKISYALILEDDAIPQPALCEFLRKEAYKDAEVTQFYIKRMAYVLWSGAKPVLNGYTSYLRAPSIPKAGAAGYVVSLNAAKHFVENAIPVTQQADLFDCAYDLMKAKKWRVVLPLLVKHPEGVDTLEQSVLDIGRKEVKKRRFLGRFHRRRMKKNYGLLPRKLFYKRISTKP
ncbi:MAG: glycosyltransferase family 25 protein [Aestuariivita sp.]|nr:glycosyltransferase family 25 protein [Aestuariivita sp.]